MYGAEPSVPNREVSRGSFIKFGGIMMSFIQRFLF